ncbi:hypothetical protein [Aminipila luticellarii]|uniref:DUF1492 domain-containing protein n=1 Tax=Aminipila luticellarii TaxID=2507160 RepID=A0A410PWW0_9FIRM|nr:hypothetical protein [Aminipila luticellarii]QAT43452.1 hypothetical protein EQM06_09615 [Aminipila luticellarii]
MTKEELEQIYHLNNEIKMWQRELERLRCKSIVGSPEITGMPRGNNTSDPTAGLVASIEECEKIIEGKLAEIQFTRKKVIEYINNIEDSYMRQVVFYRNCSLMTWKQVAHEIGQGYTSESVRQSYCRFIEESVTHVTTQ